MYVALYIVAIGVLVALDQLTKYLVLLHLADGQVVTVLPGIVQFRHVENSGMAFSLLSDKTWLLALFTVVVLVACVVLLVTERIEGKWKQFALLLIIAGGLGNLIDRVFRHSVVDFIEVTFTHFAIFNVADIFVTCGAALLIIILLVEIFRGEEGDQHGAE